ncbi:MAG TPA: hypothetical protein VKX17_14685 [Planctomycetota bacterium]|nr:hypothetical protein [Planctomycetota bacterium]
MSGVKKNQQSRRDGEPGASTPADRNTDSNAPNAHASTGPVAPVAPLAAASPEARAVQRSMSARLNGPRFWALPDKKLKWWVLCENDMGTVESLTSGTPVIYIPPLPDLRRGAAAECCRQMVMARLRDRCHEHFFQLIKRMLLGGMLIFAGIVALKFLEAFDTLLLVGALGYTMHAGLRYGLRFLHSWEATSRPFSHFTGEPFVESKLADRLAQALDFRRTLPPDKRGESPDAELLDANAYRKLIREGAITKEELVALGKAIEARLNLRGVEPKHFSDMARAEGLDGESAALYRDLAQAASEIAYETDLA